ncbi:putative 3'-5' exonuclease domain, K domain, ribonuclease H-like superfamily [Helianthus annuus]|nr:putative 3'-5' exonuclease domain, K domain, ribonuclease H-like superfamily [Helianthus annuus]KAJ0631239.1 putative 3'-5' exonuclease domain, K domain, ribonuclease H-like superfamily [Helianthus annuus]KAJ0635113.1 putative 3'-5' exonuclease domain, K domain, ribonuclease H-like superfamily [Helianthus annuus]KAJ0824850.1 putative 3'-5' exonuclease domain, K domain, ribonuclease H-like superfamily [Helianthus annuus]
MSKSNRKVKSAVYLSAVKTGIGFTLFICFDGSTIAMASSNHLTSIPLPSDPGGEVVPVHIVTHASQLPPEFLKPSPDKKLVIGFDCEGVDLCRNGTLCIMQLAFPDAIYLVDAIEGGKTLVEACKPALESSYITKVIHDCKRDSEALYFQFNIKLHNVFDTQIAYSLIEEQEGGTKVPDDYISFVGLLADPRYCGISYLEKQEVRVLLRQDPNFWKYRPLSELMVRAATDDVRFLLYIYNKMVVKMNQKSLWYLAVRGALYCRCFCITDNNYADWPPIPPIPEDIITDDNALEEEILSVVDVPPGKMGVVIGRRGASILAIKESCNAEIFIGGDKGPPDKVFVIGPVKQVRKAEAILRGRMLEIY